MSSSTARAASKADELRGLVDLAASEGTRVAALLTLARHYVDIGDGVKGLGAAREAREAAMTMGDDAAISHALNSISISQYNRSEYVSSITTALDAWDYARRSGLARQVAESFYSIGLSLFGLGLLDEADRASARGLAFAATSQDGLEARVRLTRLRGILASAHGDMRAAEELFEEATTLAARSTATQLEACHAVWSIAWLRHMDEQYGGRGVIPGKLDAVIAHLEKALAIAADEGNDYLVTDRTAMLGVALFLSGHLEHAERQLDAARRAARSLDYVRALVVATVYVARLHFARGNAAAAADVLEEAIAQARRGAADDVIVYARTLRARALEALGRTREAAEERGLANEFREERQESRRRSGEEVMHLLRPFLASRGDDGT